MSHYTLFPNQLTNYSPFTYYKEIFTEEECVKIISLFKDSFRAKIGEGDLNPNVRSTSVCFIPYEVENDWIFKRLSDFAMPANQARYGFQLSGFLEGIQLTKYEGEGDHYDWHLDNGAGLQSRRKLSLVVQLSDPDDYEGCELKFAGLESSHVPTNKGDLIVFPSYHAHKVTKLKKGTRYSLVAWISGEPYR